jgi:hypothetical protein
MKFGIMKGAHLGVLHFYCALNLIQRLSEPHYTVYPRSAEVTPHPSGG